jgi:hypothetical protein
MKIFQRLVLVAVFLGCASCTRSHSQMQAPETQPVALQLQLDTPFHFVAYGDSRFHDPKDTESANPSARQALVQGIAEVKPAFISFGGDIVYNGYDANDWKVWDRENHRLAREKDSRIPSFGQS